MKKWIIVVLILSSFSGFAQKKKTAPENWFNLDYKKNKVYGVSTEKAYAELLNDKKAQDIVVAVIDGGTDTAHEDLRDIIWTNPGEIAGNGIDDDKNGFVDDLHGWNFIGGKDPNENVKEDTYELTRVYASLNKKFGDMEIAKLTEAQRPAYKKYLAVKAEYDEKKKDYEGRVEFFKDVSKAIDDIIKQSRKQKPTLADVQKFEVSTQAEKVAKLTVMAFVAEDKDLQELKDLVKKTTEDVEAYVKYHLNTEFDPRSTIVKDNYDDVSESNYGNNNVKGPKAEHGSHVAGIIAAVRNNNIGMMGVASHVKIMVLRVVPNGDERDKDVANAIRYAANNGARVINMSFGKDYSWNKKAVDDAVKYAMQKDVLIVHAAGNDSKNLDSTDNYPNRKFENSSSEASNWIEVGASSWMKGKYLTADFSNYGVTRVDVFAPGVDIYSTVPDTTKYATYDGTSMAAPVTSGVAALIRCYYPQLSAVEVKEIIMNSVVPIKKKVYIPGTKKTTKLKTLCISGGIVNAYNALKMAETYKKN